MEDQYLAHPRLGDNSAQSPLRVVYPGKGLLFISNENSRKTQSAYHSTKISEIFETETNSTEISWGKFQKFWKLLNFRKANHSTENSRNSGMKVKWNGNLEKKIFENLGIPHEVVISHWKHCSASSNQRGTAASLLMSFQNFTSGI